MTDEFEDMTETGDADGAADPEVKDALADMGAIEQETEDSPEADGESESGRFSGLFGRLTELSGTGADLDSYEDDPIAQAVDPDPDAEETHRGAKHIARGIDGLSPLAATNPLIDIAVGVLLISVDDKTDGAVFGTEDNGADPNVDGVNPDRGDMGDLS